MKVKIIVGAEAAYVVIDAGPRSLDLRLSPGKSAGDSMRASAMEMREQAARLLARGELIESASLML